MKDRKFKAFLIIALMLFILAVLTIIKNPNDWAGVAGAFITGLVAVATTYFGGNVAHAAQKSKFFNPELQEGEKDAGK